MPEEHAGDAYGGRVSRDVRPETCDGALILGTQPARGRIQRVETTYADEVAHACGAF